MADAVSAIVVPDAVTLDGSEHIMVSQSGNLRRVLISTLLNLSSGSSLALILPTADPHVVGALWNNSGTITISAG